MLKFFSLLFACSFLLTSCANMDKSMCLTANWQNIGFEDGAAGRPQTEISQHRKDCAKHGVTPDLSTYRSGHDQGSALFCTTDNGFRQGSAGKSYKNNCSDSLANAFLSGFKDGEILHQSKVVLERAHADLDHLLGDIVKVQSKIEQQTELMIADGLSRDERVKIRDDIAALQAELEELYLQRPEFEQQLSAAQYDYESTLQRFSGYN